MQQISLTIISPLELKSKIRTMPLAVSKYACKAMPDTSLFGGLGCFKPLDFFDWYRPGSGYVQVLYRCVYLGVHYLHSGTAAFSYWSAGLHTRAGPGSHWLTAQGLNFRHGNRTQRSYRRGRIQWPLQGRLGDNLVCGACPGNSRVPLRQPGDGLRSAAKSGWGTLKDGQGHCKQDCCKDGQLQRREREKEREREGERT